MFVIVAVTTGQLAAAARANAVRAKRGKPRSARSTISPAGLQSPPSLPKFPPRCRII